MKKTLNLYHASCQPEKLNFNFMQLIIVFVVCILLVGLAQTLLINRASNMEEKEIIALNKLLALQDELSTLVIKVQANRAPENKVNEKNQLIMEVAAKRGLLSNLNQIDLGLLVSFSELMLGLAKADTEQVSITTFYISNGKLDIQGNASQSNSVPIWLSSIQTTTELHFVSFSAVNIIEQENNFLFQLSNVGLKAKAKGSK